MEMEPLVSLGYGAPLHTETSVQDQNPCALTSTPDPVEPQQPVKKQTRQWAAWTRQEEESFFTALRQVGKNFEKITHRVQSKNKDQVRHYYYRLVRRMNKLLGPGLCLDAKDSKDTNAAMLRWWALLEKYSCKASKLHLKPRRFKIFLEALENQLIKDRKKNVRKRPLQGETGSPTGISTVANQNKASTQDSRAVKLVLVDGQSIQKLGSSKGPLKRNVNVGVVRHTNKGGDSGIMKPPRQRRKPGVATSAAYQKWERAAIAGVSLVADAAEHLERTEIDKDVDDGQVRAQKGLELVDKALVPLPASSHLQNVDNNTYSSTKLKLQFFPIDDTTRRAMELDKRNPHLELTLSARKKISSVLEHLNRKWGDSCVALGELMLFPYAANIDNLLGDQRWTQHSTVSAADVYNSLGRPPVFRLRYGWFSDSGGAAALLQAHSKLTNDEVQKLMNVRKDPLAVVNGNSARESLPMDIPSDINVYVSQGPKCNSSISPENNLLCSRKGTDEATNMKQMEDGNVLGMTNSTTLSAGEWADSLTNISVGDLLSDVPNDCNTSNIVLPIAQNDQCLQQIPFSCDSFDAAIAAHISKHQDKLGFLPAVQPQTSSIWDADETCDAFSFQRSGILCQEAPTTSSSSPRAAGEQEVHNRERQIDYSGDGDPMDEGPCEPEVMDTSGKDFSALADIYWPDSLGPLDLDTPSCKYHSEDIILSDSLGGLNRLIASSLDAFQSCSFLGLEKKDSASTLEARDSSSFSDFKVGGGV
ncbi:unnamed protein product [Linum trigynum]|uniref:TSL-kinase interacting protein 1 n=2 Tax=Linum trigynum TaxID=586398 RepID=A0AAV2DZL1_9ROSI